jgi:hypothetical protein
MRRVRASRSTARLAGHRETGRLTSTRTTSKRFFVKLLGPWSDNETDLDLSLTSGAAGSPEPHALYFTNLNKTESPSQSLSKSLSTTPGMYFRGWSLSSTFTPGSIPAEAGY